MMFLCLLFLSDSVVQQIRVFIREDTFHIFSQIQEISHFTSTLSFNTPRMPRIIWEDDIGEELVFDGRSITMTSFRVMYGKLLQDTEDLLRNDILLGLDLPDITHERIHDNLSCTDVGYSFITDKANKFYLHRLFLIEAMLLDERFQSKFVHAEHCNDHGIVWNTSGIHAWFKSCERCLGNLFALLHYGAGQPARGTELTILSLVNTSLHARNIYWFKKLVNIVTTYNKTQTTLEKPRVIARSLPPPVGELYITWMTFVVPTLATIAACFEAPQTTISVRFRDSLFTSLSGPWDSDDLSSILMAISGEPIARQGLGHPMGIADTRHLLIAIMRKHLRGISNHSVLEEYFNEQSGHGDDVAEGYAVSFDTIRNVPEERLALFVEVSKRQHKLLFPDDAEAPNTPLPPTSLSATAPSSATSPLDYQKLAAIMAPAVSSQISTLLAPGLNKTIVEAYASLDPIHQPSLPPSFPASNQNNLPATQLEMNVVDLNRVELSPERYAELRVLMGDDASFKSLAQAAAIELSAQRERDLLVILGTGGGKTLIFMAAAVNAAEASAGLATVVVVPLIALLEDLQSRLKEKNIRTMRWMTPGTRHYQTRIILVSADLAGTSGFLSYLLEGCKTRKIGRLVLDEVHYILLAAHFRPVLENIKRLRETLIPFVLLTATMPPSATGLLLKQLNMLPSSTSIIRAETVRPEIVYSCFKLTGHHSTHYHSKAGEQKSVLDYCQELLTQFGVDGRALVFCLSKADADYLATVLGCQSHHAGMKPDERTSIVTNWKCGIHNILVTTSSLGAGVDYPNVVLVIHYGKPRNIIDYAQESGRVARNLPCGYSTIFFDASARSFPLQIGQLDLGVAEMERFLTLPQCRRMTLGVYLDGKNVSCFSIGTAALCDWCESQVPSTVSAHSLSFYQGIPNPSLILIFSQPVLSTGVFCCCPSHFPPSFQFAGPAGLQDNAKV